MSRTLPLGKGRSVRPRSPYSLCVGLMLAMISLAALPTSAANMVVGASSLSFFSVQGGANPASQSFYAYPDTQGTAFNPTVTANTNNGGNWLTLSFANGDGAVAVCGSLIYGAGCAGLRRQAQPSRHPARR